MTVRVFTIGNNIKNKEFPLISDRFSVKILKVNKVKIFIKTVKGINRSKILIGRFRDFRRSLIFTVNIMKLIFEDIINSRSKFRKESSVIEEELSALLWNSKKDMSVRAFDDITGNFLSPCSRIFEAA